RPHAQIGERVHGSAPPIPWVAPPPPRPCGPPAPPAVDACVRSVAVAARKTEGAEITHASTTTAASIRAVITTSSRIRRRRRRRPWQRSFYARGALPARPRSASSLVALLARIAFDDLLLQRTASSCSRR